MAYGNTGGGSIRGGTASNPVGGGGYSPGGGAGGGGAGGGGGGIGGRRGGVNGSGFFAGSRSASTRARDSIVTSALTPEQEEYQRRLRAAGLLLDSQGALI